MAARRDGFVTRISHDLYRTLVGEARREAGTPAPAGRVLDHQPHPGRWHWLQEAMRQSIEQAQAEASEHREIAREQRFVLERIELAPEGEALRQRLERFLREFDAAARVGWVRRIWPGRAEDGIVLEALREVCLPAPDEPAADADAYERALRAKPAAEADGGLTIRFVGSWREPVAAPVAGAAGSVEATLLIRDAQGQRAVDMRGPELIVGSAGEVPVHGRYVSRRHLRLFVEDGRLWLQDAASSNGVWLADGRLPAEARREICEREDVRLGAAQDAANLGDGDCPRLLVTRVLARAAGPGVTPLLGAAPTPVLAPSPPLLTLTLAATGWRREVAIHHLPFTLGRSHDCDLCLPAENAAVSGHHLRLLQLDLPGGVWVEDLGSTRGTYRAGERSSGRFLLPLGETLTLGGADLDEHHRPVQLTALRTEAP